MAEKEYRPKGENLVWFTGMGLAVGLLMVFVLLAVIFVNGITVFWPKQIVEVQLVEGADAAIQGVDHFAGHVTIDRYAKDLRPGKTELKRELQFFVGNKDVYGFMYKFVDYEQIESMAPARGLMEMERLEYGNAIGYPKKLVLADGREVSVGDADFGQVFDDVFEQAQQRRKDIRSIEKGDIGRINFEMDKLRIKLRSLERKFGSDAAVSKPEYRKAEERMEILQAEYDVLAAGAKEMREAQEADVFTYELPTGQEKQLPMGELTYYYYPDRLGFFDKVAFFVGHVWGFVSGNPREANTEGGIFPAIFGTFVMTVLMSIAVMPFGVLAAIYLREYATQGPFVRSVRIAVNNLAGVPSIVYGVFGLGFFVYVLGGSIDDLFFSDRLPTPTFGTGGILWASLTLALMTVPVVVVSTEEALSAVPRGMREASLACGASKWQTIQRIVLPASAPGMLTGLVLAMARGAGEVAPLMLVGVVKMAPSLPIDGYFPYVHLERKFMHLGFHIYDLAFQSPDSEAAKPMVFATTLLLIALVVILNLGAITIRNRLRKRYQTGAF
ncbi:MAG: phosphate ABC transporter permease PstA [Puniceicoccaceae bacterium]